MPLRIQTALLCLIAAPLAMLGWIGVASIRSGELSSQRHIASLAEGRLLELTRSIDEVMATQHRHIKQTMDQEGKLPDRLMLLERTDPSVRRTMWVSARGQLLYPPAPYSTLSNDFLVYNELSLMARQRPPVSIAIRKELAARKLPTSELSSELLVLPKTVESNADEAEPIVTEKQQASKVVSPWHESYFDEGLQLVVWSVRPDGSAIGCWLERARWIADLIAVLPDVDPATSEGATALLDANGNVVYRWGAIDIPMESPLAETALKEPLASWRLRYYLPANRRNTSTLWIYWPWGLAFFAGALSLLTLGAYVTFATTQQLRLANQRVSFVGQVSHELRTPLTNIRLYAEMAKRDLSFAEPAVHRISERLDVIDSESKRLSRLISGVLEFMQGRTKAMPLAWRSVVPDETVRQVLAQSSISLDRCGIVVSLDLNANQRVEMDSDVLEQILINLVNNVEKYAASGKRLHITSRLDAEILTIEVIDSGPGIAIRFGKRIFQPFYRLDDSITAPSGTGLGLTIARAAAKRHGGGLELLPSKCGAHLRLWLRVRSDSSDLQGVEA